MSVVVEQADMFTIDADMYVCPTNCLGVFGAGLAKTFAETWPHIVMPYQLAAASGEIGPGDVRPDLLGPNPYGATARVAMMATKDHWRDPSRLEWIDRGLYLLSILCQLPSLIPRRRVVMPAVGCGLGGLAFQDVHNLVVGYFDHALSPADILLIPPK